MYKIIFCLKWDLQQKLGYNCSDAHVHKWHPEKKIQYSNRCPCHHNMVNTWRMTNKWHHNHNHTTLGHEKGNGLDRTRVGVNVYAWMGVCVRERERERERVCVFVSKCNEWVREIENIKEDYCRYLDAKNVKICNLIYCLITTKQQ